MPAGHTLCAVTGAPVAGGEGELQAGRDMIWILVWLCALHMEQKSELGYVGYVGPGSLDHAANTRNVIASLYYLHDASKQANGLAKQGEQGYDALVHSHADSRSV